ncbi:28S ribosomal protein S2, mitochondrial, putative [Brugia malayi]|uniref:28S ribosomal protein S2, mitochondrial, putative n=1 Tax=Brugia malayi TaxID=6279 RepID=A0A4E9FPN4_BRUMA|nr:28S ribosomal protein S2, mitochondrial, putative [Brugia malayi]VIO99008.1 28S ribosomal protein S2, mitochondrial, putative [Brugia malayi]
MPKPVFLRRFAMTFRHCVREHASVVEEPSTDLLEKATVRPFVLLNYVDDILKERDHFGFKKMITIDDLFHARVHYGHKKTRECLITALNFVAHLAMRGGMFLFITTERNNMLMVERKALEINEFAHVRGWKEDTLLNAKALFGAPVRLPDTIIFLSTLTSVLETHPAVREAAKMVIPTIGIVDSNADPTNITYPIPGNDDSVSSVQYFMDCFVKAVKVGKEARRSLLSN